MISHQSNSKIQKLISSVKRLERMENNNDFSPAANDNFQAALKDLTNLISRLEQHECRTD